MEARFYASDRRVPSQERPPKKHSLFRIVWSDMLSIIFYFRVRECFTEMAFLHEPAGSEPPQTELMMPTLKPGWEA